VRPRPVYISARAERLTKKGAGWSLALEKKVRCGRAIARTQPHPETGVGAGADGRGRRRSVRTSWRRSRWRTVEECHLRPAVEVEEPRPARATRLQSPPAAPVTAQVLVLTPIFAPPP
jgi:hypothetical protein